MSVFCATY